MPESHGITHALAVLSNLNKAILSSKIPIDDDVSLAMQLAALLHDADDRKYFEHSSGYQNAVQIMNEIVDNQNVIQDVVLMISYVSASSNGNSVPEECIKRPYLLWPRFSDRLEAIGTIGMVRCFQYN